ncbi:MAG TPA: universal stress protein [Anaerolineae bacterium]|nr:universal stress protein [Anaerolineae bacterium]
MKENVSPTTHDFALIGIGGKPLDKASMGFIAFMLPTLGLQPVLLHVIQSEKQAAEATRILESAVKMLGIPTADNIQRTGDIAVEIKKELLSRDYGLMVLGAHGISPGQPPSSFNQKLAMSVPHSVLLVRPPAEALKRILICTSGGPTSDRLVEWGLQIASVAATPITLMHVASSTPGMFTGLPSFTEDLSDLLSRDTPLSNHLKSIAAMAEEAGVEAQLELRHGMVAEEIVRACEMQIYDLIVLGAAKSPASVDAWLRDEVTPQVLSSLSCSILIVRDHNL